MTYIEILNEWGKYSKYDAEQRQFNLLSVDYHFHKIGEVIEKILKEYDPSGMLAVIYAKMKFEQLLKEVKMSYWDAIMQKETYQEDEKMYRMFLSDEVLQAEEDFIGRLNQIYLKITNGKLIGEDDGERAKFFDCTERVLESIGKCNVDLFSKGGKIENVQNISTKLHIFNTLAECLLTLEKAPDGMYFCFVRAGDTADCFFAFFVKSNGTILSVNDRIDEAYIGQHGNSRNGRWAEDKADKIFPYDYIFSYSQHDYKGYASKYEIDESKLELYNLGIEVFMPIVIAMLLILLKYSNQELNLPVHYVDSFLPENRLAIESNALMVIKDSSLAECHNQVDLFFDNQKILNGDYAEDFHWKNQKENETYKETGHFNNHNQMLVDLWGEGFEFDTGAVFSVNNVKSLIDKENDSYVPEFVGTEKRMRLQVYTEARRQLADYIESKMYDAWVDAGKTEGIKNWYQNALLKNKEFLFQLMKNYEEFVLDKETPEWSLPGKLQIRVVNDTNPSGHGLWLGRSDILGCVCNEYKWEFYDSGNGYRCNTWFFFQPGTWEDLELLTGVEVPKIVKTWTNPHYNYRGYSGNSLLNATDKVDRLVTPFEKRNSFESDKIQWGNSEYDFCFVWGFSKRGWNKIKKEMN